MLAQVSWTEDVYCAVACDFVITVDFFVNVLMMSEKVFLWSVLPDDNSGEAKAMLQTICVAYNAKLCLYILYLIVIYMCSCTR